MTSSVQRLAEQVKALPEEDLDEFLAWLAQYELEQLDEWDRDIERDAPPGGRLEAILKQARKDIAQGKFENAEHCAG